MTHSPSASLSSANTRAIFLLASNKPPYGVYCNPFYKPHADALTVFTADPSTGALQDPPVQHAPLDSEAGIHGAVFDPHEEKYLYSADLTGNRIWVHRRGSNDDPTSAELTLLHSVPAPSPHDHPRWCAIHPTGNYLYVLMENSNLLREFLIDPTTHRPVYTHHSYPLIPPGVPGGDPSAPKPDRMYRADNCFLSSSGRHLFASARANSFDLTGYLSVFRLRPCGSIETQLHLLPTPTSGGHSNAVSPCPWSDEWLALTDDQDGYVEMYRWRDEFLHRVARCQVREPGFGMNAVWYD